MTENEIMEELLDLSCALSPENLSCDGELSRNRVRTRYRRLMKKWRDLEKKLGRTITEEEVWEWKQKVSTE